MTATYRERAVRRARELAAATGGEGAAALARAGRQVAAGLAEFVGLPLAGGRAVAVVTREPRGDDEAIWSLADGPDAPAIRGLGGLSVAVGRGPLGGGAVVGPRLRLYVRGTCQVEGPADGPTLDAVLLRVADVLAPALDAARLGPAEAAAAPGNPADSA